MNVDEVPVPSNPKLKLFVTDPDLLSVSDPDSSESGYESESGSGGSGFSTKFSKN